MSKGVLTTALLLATAAPAFAADVPHMTRDNGAPIGDNRNSRTAGEHGGVLLEDIHLIEKLARFDRERIPERVVHARGTGAYGNFVVDGDITQFSKAAVFKPGTKTDVFVRFSTVVHPKGSPEALRDPRGFATKFYTTEGNWDLVGNNFPVFFIRDAKQFPDMVHAFKPSPVTNKQDANRVFDFFIHTPESVHTHTYLFSDMGTPKSYREMDGNSVHAYRLPNDKGEVVFAKFHWKSRQGIKTLTAEQAEVINFNYATNDLYENISKGNYPVWDLYVKILKPQDIAKLNYNPFDATKDWYGFEEIKVGTMTLNKVPDNFFEHSEQAALAPSNFVPGIDASPDRLLQGRLFSYADTQRYRLGINHNLLPVNAPRVKVVNNNQDGFQNNSGRSADVNYYPSVLAPKVTNVRLEAPAYELEGVAQAKPISLTNDYEHAGILYRSFTEEQKRNLIKNLAGDLNQVRDQKTKTIMVSHFWQADADYGTRLAKATNLKLEDVKKAAADFNAQRQAQLAEAR